MKIEFKNVSKSFKNVNVLHDINVEFTSGHIYGLVGRNGSGKSVFLKMLCAFYEPTSGEILFDGVNVIKAKAFPPETGALIERPSFIADISGFENLKMLAAIQHKIGDKEILEWIDKVGLAPDKDKKYKDYSLGTKQKLGIIQAMMEDQKIIILDEPFNGVEEATVKLLRNILLEEKSKGKIIVLASHIKEDIIELADRTYIFDNGTISSTEVLKDQPNL